MPTKSQIIETQTAMLADPIGWLRGHLNGDAGHLSSLELHRRTGVPASSTRSLRNGSNINMYASSWGPLAAEVLRELELQSKARDKKRPA